MQQVIAAHFLAGAILSWALPVGLLALVGLYWWFVLRKSDLDEELDRDRS
jgi:cytochrome c-type biogenesis protein CcmH/NrfF